MNHVLGVCEMPQQRLYRKLRQHVPADTQQRLQETENLHRKSYTNYNRLDGKYPGHKVQVDIKYVPNECIRFPCYGQRYCQITAIDEYSRKRVLKIVKEKSSCETGKFLQSPEKKMRFKISIIRADNGTEFVNDEDRYNRTAKTSLDFKSPDRIVGEYFSKCNICLDS